MPHGLTKHFCSCSNVPTFGEIYPITCMKIIGLKERFFFYHTNVLSSDIILTARPSVYRRANGIK